MPAVLSAPVRAAVAAAASPFSSASSTRCTLRQLSARFAETDGDIRNLLVDITLTDAFRDIANNLKRSQLVQ